MYIEMGNRTGEKKMIITLCLIAIVALAASALLEGRGRIVVADSSVSENGRDWCASLISELVLDEVAHNANLNVINAVHWSLSRSMEIDLQDCYIKPSDFTWDHALDSVALLDRDLQVTGTEIVGLSSDYHLGNVILVA
jgi:hypothetical protein